MSTMFDDVAKATVPALGAIVGMAAFLYGGMAALSLWVGARWYFELTYQTASQHPYLAPVCMLTGSFLFYAAIRSAGDSR